MKLFDRSFEKAATIEQMVEILQIFFPFGQRSSFNENLTEKIRLVSRRFVEETDFSRCRIDDEYPKCSGKVMRIRRWFDRFKFNFDLILDENEKSKIENRREKVRRSVEEMETKIFQLWWNETTEIDAKQLLKKVFLKRNSKKSSLIDVDFDREIIDALNESLVWSRMNFQIPFSLIEVYQTRRSLTKLREKTNEIVRKFNNSIRSLTDDEELLFEQRIENVFNKLQPAFEGKVTPNDRTKFEEFINKSNQIVDEVREHR